MVSKPQHHNMFWTAMLGKYEFEEYLCSNPWADMYCCDVMSLEDYDGMYYLVKEMESQYEQRQGRALRLLL
eukprot:3219363-Karenia_brevis.AAC.1